MGKATTRQPTLPAAVRITVRATGTASTAVASLSVTAVWVDPVSSRNRNGPLAPTIDGHDDFARTARREPGRGAGPGVRRVGAGGRGERGKRHEKHDVCSHGRPPRRVGASVRAEGPDGRDARVMFRGCSARPGHRPGPRRGQAGTTPGGGRAEAGRRPGGGGGGGGGRAEAGRGGGWARAGEPHACGRGGPLPTSFRN